MKTLNYIIVIIFTVTQFVLGQGLIPLSLPGVESGTVTSQFNPPKSATGKVQIFKNGTIYINADEKVRNIVVTGGIVQDYNIDPQNYPGAEIIDLKGNTAYPGFNDSHVHLLETSPFFVLGINMTKCFNSQAMADSIRARVASLSEGDLIIGVGFSLEDYDKWTLDDLGRIDAAAGNHPVFIGDKLGHNAIINTATMRLCGITPGIKVPMGGKIGIQAGQLTGMLRESAMTLAGNKIFTMIDKNLIKKTALNMFNYWASIGYSGVVDLMGSAAGRMMYPGIAMELEAEGKLPLRVHYCYTFYDLKEIDSALVYKTMNTEMVRFAGCKLFVDGAYAAGQAWTSWPNQQGNNGLFYVRPDDSLGEEYNLNRIVEKLELNGLNCHYHIQGDQGIENLLNALDSVVAKRGGLSSIHTIIHAAFITESQLNRIKNFNGKVVLTMQPGFWEVEDNLQYYYGTHSDEAYPAKDIINSGVSVGMSTDFTVSPLNYCPVSKVIGVSVTGGGKPTHHKPLSVRDMIHGFSFGSNATTPSTDLGKLEKGYKADMVVFNKDLYTVALNEFSAQNPKVMAVWIGGRNTFNANGIEPPVYVPTEMSLFQNYPNPFNPSTTIRWQSPVSGITTLTVFDLLGRRVKTLVNEYRDAGDYKIDFDAKNLSSGVYFYQLQVKDRILSRKLIIVK